MTELRLNIFFWKEDNRSWYSLLTIGRKEGWGLEHSDGWGAGALYILLLLLLLVSRFSCVTPYTSVWPHRRQSTRLLCPWDSPSKNTGVGCHFLLQCMKVKSESKVTQSYSTLSNPVDCSLPGSSVHGIFQARVLEWGAIAFSDFIFYRTAKKG